MDTALDWDEMVVHIGEADERHVAVEAHRDGRRLWRTLLDVTSGAIDEQARLHRGAVVLERRRLLRVEATSEHSRGGGGPAYRWLVDENGKIVEGPSNI